MKKLSAQEVEEKQKDIGHAIMDKRVDADYAKANMLFEVVGHNRTTIDITPSFIQAAKALKVARDKGNTDVVMFKLNTASGRKEQVWINPEY